MRKPHKHAALIKAWADGAEIEIYRAHSADWIGYKEFENPSWDEDYEYRIKPEPKPDVVYELRAFQDSLSNECCSLLVPHLCWPTDVSPATLKLTFDGETGKLKSAEVI